jgi:hypothetical protein
MKGEGSIVKEVEESGHGLILSCYPGIFLEGLNKNMKTLNQDSQSPHLSPGPPEYEAGVLTTHPQSSV